MSSVSKPAANLKYTKSHEWARLEADGTVTVGITDHAQAALGDIVFLELPDAGRKLKAGEECAVVESVKAASDIYAPIAGEVVPKNDPAADAPESVNQDAYATWLCFIDAHRLQTLAQQHIQTQTVFGGEFHN